MKFLLVYSTLLVITKAATPKNTVTKLFLLDYENPEGSKIRNMTKWLEEHKETTPVTQSIQDEMNQLYQDYMQEHYPNEKCWTIKKFEAKNELKFEHWLIIDRKCYNAARIIRVVAAFFGFAVLFVVVAMILDRREKNKLEAQMYKFAFLFSRRRDVLRKIINFVILYGRQENVHFSSNVYRNIVTKPYLIGIHDNIKIHNAIYTM